MAFRSLEPSKIIITLHHFHCAPCVCELFLRNQLSMGWIRLRSFVSREFWWFCWIFCRSGLCASGTSVWNLWLVRSKWSDSIDQTERLPSTERVCFAFVKLLPVSCRQMHISGKPRRITRWVILRKQQLTRHTVYVAARGKNYRSHFPAPLLVLACKCARHKYALVANIKSWLKGFWAYGDEGSQAVFVCGTQVKNDSQSSRFIFHSSTTGMQSGEIVRRCWNESFFIIKTSIFQSRFRMRIGK